VIDTAQADDLAATFVRRVQTTLSGTG
jgi:hypothetical protein